MAYSFSCFFLVARLYVITDTWNYAITPGPPGGRGASSSCMSLLPARGLRARCSECATGACSSQCLFGSVVVVCLSTLSLCGSDAQPQWERPHVQEFRFREYARDQWTYRRRHGNAGQRPNWRATDPSNSGHQPYDWTGTSLQVLCRVEGLWVDFHGDVFEVSSQGSTMRCWSLVVILWSTTVRCPSSWYVLLCRFSPSACFSLLTTWIVSPFPSTFASLTTFPHVVSEFRSQRWAGRDIAHGLGKS